MTDQAVRHHRVDPALADRFDWGTIQWLAGQHLIPDARLTFGVCEMAVGARNPLHVHPNCDELLFLLDGELEHSLGDEVHRLRSGSALYIPSGVVHTARNVGDAPARIMIAFSAGDRQVVTLEEGQE